MWNNTGSLAQISVFGHVVIRGTGHIGVKVSEKVKVSIEIDAAVLIDADYKDDVLEAILSDGSEGTDFALLISGSATQRNSQKRPDVCSA